MRHPTFGEGEVLRSLEDETKYEIAFSVGTKVLLARFVTPCE